MALLAHGITSIHGVLSAAREKLVELMRSEARAQALIDAMACTTGPSPTRVQAAQSKLAKEIGLEALVVAANSTLGVEYEVAVTNLLRVETAWGVTVLDDGIRQNVPDLLLSLGSIEILLECKTCTKSPPLIKKEEAWAVIQKAADYAPSMRRVTLGKPAFDETCKKKVASSSDITLVEHADFVEGLLRVHSGRLTPQGFLIWLGTPGFAEIERLPGQPSYA
jgi:helicase